MNRCSFICSVGLQAMLMLPLMAEERTPGWPSFNGDGTFSIPALGIPLVATPDQARVAWRYDEHMGVQKSGDCEDGQFYGATATVIVSDGIAYTSYIRPTGDVLNEKTVNRYYPLEKQSKSMRQIDGDDVTVAVDAATGKLIWRAEEKGRSMSFLFGKRGHYGVSPAAGAGRVFVWGGLGVIYAYDAKKGTKAWEFAVQPFADQAAKAKAKAIESRTILDTYGKLPLFSDLKTGLICADNILVAPDGFGGLIGLDAGSGAKRWEVKGVIARGATPAIWRKNGKAYLLCPMGDKTDGKATMIDAATGAVLWTQALTGPNHTSLVIGDGDIVLMNTRGNLLMGSKGPGDDQKKASGLFAGYRISLTGATHLWTLEDIEENWHRVRKDRGMDRRVAIHQGFAYVLLGVKSDEGDEGEKPDNAGAAGTTPYRVVSIELETGKIVFRSKEDFDNCFTSPVVVEDRLVFAEDISHAWGTVKYPMYQLQPKGQLKYLGVIPVSEKLKLEMVTDYEVPNEVAWWKGCFIAKFRHGLACVDLRAR